MKRMKRRETHLAKSGETGEMSTIRLRDDGKGRVDPSDNYQGERHGEQRDYADIKPAEQSPSNVFHQEASDDAHRMLTPSTSGITVTTEPVSYQEGQGLHNPSNPGNQFRRKHDR